MVRIITSKQQIFSVRSSPDPAKIGFSPNLVLIRAHLCSVRVARCRKNVHGWGSSLPKCSFDSSLIPRCEAKHYVLNTYQRFASSYNILLCSNAFFKSTGFIAADCESPILVFNSKIASHRFWDIVIVPFSMISVFCSLHTLEIKYFIMIAMCT